MKSILEELYRGNLSPEEQMVPTSPEYRPLNRKISELKAEVKDRFLSVILKLLSKSLI